MSDVVQAKPTTRLPMIALRGLVLFPKMVLHFDVAREKSVLALNEAMATDRRIFLVAQKDVREDSPAVKDLYSVGVVAKVLQILKPSGDAIRVVVEGIYRAKTLEIFSDGDFLEVECEEYPTKPIRNSKNVLCDALMRTLKDLFEEYCYLSPKMPKELVINVMVNDDPVTLVEYIAGNIPIAMEDKQAILTESNRIKRMEILASVLENENSILGLEREIYDKVKDQIDKNQREYYLREQLKAINEELGENTSYYDALEQYRMKILDLDLAEEIQDKFLDEVDKLSRMSASSQEAMVTRNYLDMCLSLPWNHKTKDKIDVLKARKQLDRDHYGLDKVKDRIVESMAVRKLAPDIKGQIICLVGPPGVGKTSIAKSIAKAMGRTYTRLSLGGVRDESDIRGHRKTYVGAMPGRIINAMKLAGSKNPLILLDEIDKLGNDFRGDPSSALLEVLDAEQNYAFRDHYIEVPFDLSDVFFIATANNAENIPAPLYDRMEVIHLSSYTREEKFHIGKKYLVPKQMKKHGLTSKMFKINDAALYALIDFYTREAGVRTLEREIATLCRKVAKNIVSETYQSCLIQPTLLEELMGPKKYKDDSLDKKDVIGVANGLAWTSVGGELLQVEVAVVEGTGKLELTGSLGDVMKESAHAAVTYVRSCYHDYGIDKEFYKNTDIHIHFPEGAVPKDGPSAGITITTALVSALAKIPVRHDIAMTGEVTLRGRVLPIGGLKEKTMAAYRNHMHTVIIPKDNEPDLFEVDQIVKDSIHFVPVEDVKTVLSTALSAIPVKTRLPEELSAVLPTLPHTEPNKHSPSMTQ